MRRKGVFGQFVSTLRELLRDPVFRSAFVLLGSLAALGTVFYHFVEGWSWIDSLYFCVVTMATVGYGDFAPTTEISRLFTILLILTGVGLLVAVLGQVASHMIDSRAQDLTRRQAEVAEGKRRLGLVGTVETEVVTVVESDPASAAVASEDPAGAPSEDTDPSA